MANDIFEEVPSDEGVISSNVVVTEVTDRFEYDVYAKVNDAGCITSINSSAFLKNHDGLVKIDSGRGDKYYHAQGNYLEKPIRDANSIYNYKLVDNKAVLRTDADKQPELTKIADMHEIEVLKSKLASTDYIAAKIAEGAASKEDYADKIAERVSWRKRINELQEKHGL